MQTTYPYCHRVGKIQLRMHVALAQRALGRPLPNGAEVHHVDGNKWNNTPSNLVICQDRAYHYLLHRRARILRAGGDPQTQAICSGCKQLRAFADLNAGRSRNVCRWCNNDRARIAYHAKLGRPRTTKLTAEERSAVAKERIGRCWATRRARPGA